MSDSTRQPKYYQYKRLRELAPVRLRLLFNAERLRAYTSTIDTARTTRRPCGMVDTPNTPPTVEEITTAARICSGRFFVALSESHRNAHRATQADRGITTPPTRKTHHSEPQSQPHNRKKRPTQGSTAARVGLLSFTFRLTFFSSLAQKFDLENFQLSVKSAFCDFLGKKNCFYFPSDFSHQSSQGVHQQPPSQCNAVESLLRLVHHRADCWE